MAGEKALYVTLSGSKRELEASARSHDWDFGGVVLAKASGEIIRGNKRLEEIVRYPLLPTADAEAHVLEPESIQRRVKCGRLL